MGFNQYSVPVVASGKLFEKSEQHEMAIIKLLRHTHLEHYCIKEIKLTNQQSKALISLDHFGS